MGRIIVIEDNLVFRDHVCGMLEKAGYTTRTAYDCAGARKLLEALETDDIVLSDLRLPDGECTALLEYMRASGMRNPFVIMTDYAQVVSAVSSMKQGAADYIPKKLLQEKLMPMIRELAQKSKIRRTVPIFERRSATFQEISRRIALVAPTDMGVLILGENGTGKEHIAEKVHERSRRADRPFVAVDCGMLTGELAASELFGHRKGSFTGAVTDKAGCMEEADGGTLFLDEVGNLPPEVQQKLLPCASDQMLPSDGQHPRAQGGRAHCGGYQRESGEGGGGRTLPPRPVPPPEGVCHTNSSTARVSGGHSGSGRVFPRACQQGTGTAYGRFRQEGGKDTPDTGMGRKREGTETGGNFCRAAHGGGNSRCRQTGGIPVFADNSVLPAERRE